jgi:hypothetical protein
MEFGRILFATGVSFALFAFLLLWHSSLIQVSLLTIANATDRARRLSMHLLTICGAMFGAEKIEARSLISVTDFDMHSLTVGRSQALRQRGSRTRCT